MSFDLRSAIAAGEGPELEFKTSFRFDSKLGSVNKELSKVVAKTVAGFLNSKGGSLLIGVTDDGQVVGIADDIASLSKKTVDGFELALRNTLSLHLGVAATSAVQVEFLAEGELIVARVQCASFHSPVFFREGDRSEFYLRNGNATMPMNMAEAFDYVKSQFQAKNEAAEMIERMREAVRDEFRTELRTALAAEEAKKDIPPWLTVTTRFVVDAFLSRLAGAEGWKKIYIVSPWISEITIDTTLSSESFLRRCTDDNTTLYVVTRPPLDQWHKDAIDMIGATKRANVALLEDLHMKLYTADTDMGAFAMIGSANFTQQSMENREIGMIASAYSGGKPIVANLEYEAAQIYRTPGRKLIYRAQL